MVKNNFDRLWNSFNSGIFKGCTIIYFVNKGSPVYACPLDYKKAFDNCNYVILFRNLIFNKLFIRHITVCGSSVLEMGLLYILNPYARV